MTSLYPSRLLGGLAVISAVAAPWQVHAQTYELRGTSLVMRLPDGSPAELVFDLSVNEHKDEKWAPVKLERVQPGTAIPGTSEEKFVFGDDVTLRLQREFAVERSVLKVREKWQISQAGTPGHLKLVLKINTQEFPNGFCEFGEEILNLGDVPPLEQGAQTLTRKQETSTVKLTGHKGGTLIISASTPFQVEALALRPAKDQTSPRLELRFFWLASAPGEIYDGELEWTLRQGDPAAEQ